MCVIVCVCVCSIVDTGIYKWLLIWTPSLLFPSLTWHVNTVRDLIIRQEFKSISHSS